MDPLKLNEFVTRISEEIGRKILVSDDMRYRGKLHRAEILDAEISVANSLLNRFIIFCRKEGVTI